MTKQPQSPPAGDELDKILQTNLGDSKYYDEAKAHLYAYILAQVKEIIGNDYQIPNDSPVWDGLRRANEEHEIQRQAAQARFGGKS